MDTITQEIVQLPSRRRFHGARGGGPKGARDGAYKHAEHGSGGGGGATATGGAAAAGKGRTGSDCLTCDGLPQHHGERRVNVFVSGRRRYAQLSKLGQSVANLESSDVSARKRARIDVL